MVSSKDVSKMQVFGNVERWAFGAIAAMQPRIAEQWIGKLEAIRWDNYLSPMEAEHIVASFINQDGSRGPKWSLAQFEVFLKTRGVEPECAPYYNKCALWVTMNMLYSDHARSVMKYLHEEDIANFFYETAVEKLKDPDRTRFIREYFNV